jgi:hypothetical protein
LWHWPVLAFLRYYAGVEVLNAGFGLLFVLLTLLLTAASYYWVEVPLRSTRIPITGTLRRARKVGLWVGYASIAAMVVVTASSAEIVNRHFTEAPVSIAYTRYADPATICHGRVVGECLRGDLGSNKEILVLGDSHAAMLNLFFEQLGNELGFKARVITASSCVTIPEFDYQRITENARQACVDQITDAQKQVASAKTIFLAASWDWQLESAAFQDAVHSFLKKNMGNKKIFLMEQEPKLNRNPQRLLRFRDLGLNPETALNPKYLKANQWLKQTAASFPNVYSLNFEETGFFAQVPFYNGELMYMDEHHLNEIGARHYGATASSMFKKIIN